MTQRDLKQKIDTLWLSFHSGGITNPMTVIEQISFLIFSRLLDLTESRNEKKARRSGQPFKPIFGPDEQHLRWSSFRTCPGAEMLPLVRDKVFKHFRQVEHYGQFMRDAQLMIQKQELLVQAVNMVHDLPLEGGGDHKGDLYEYLLSKLSTAGIAGQFRTPRHIIQSMVRILDPQPMDRVCDPACGTAGFLVESLAHVMQSKTSPEGVIPAEAGASQIYTGDLLRPEERANLTNGFLTGFDFDATMLRVSAMNLLLHGVETPRIFYQDTLGSSLADNHPDSRSNAFDVILANPPFKGSLDFARVDPGLLKRVKTKKTELLFVQLIIQMLKMGGRAAVIVPDGVLFGSSKAHVALRRTLVEDNQLEAVISLPGGVFRPYAGVSTAILVFAKGGETTDVFYYDVQNDGFSLDDKRNPIEANDLPDLEQAWAERTSSMHKDRTAKAFFVPRAEIEANKYDLSITRYKEEVYEEEEYEAPERIIEQMEALEAEILGNLRELKGMLR